MTAPTALLVPSGTFAPPSFLDETSGLKSELRQAVDSLDVTAQERSPNRNDLTLIEYSFQQGDLVTFVACAAAGHKFCLRNREDQRSLLDLFCTGAEQAAVQAQQAKALQLRESWSTYVRLHGTKLLVEPDSKEARESHRMRADYEKALAVFEESLEEMTPQLSEQLREAVVQLLRLPNDLLPVEDFPSGLFIRRHPEKNIRLPSTRFLLEPLFAVVDHLGSEQRDRFYLLTKALYHSTSSTVSSFVFSQLDTRRQAEAIELVEEFWP